MKNDPLHAWRLSETLTIREAAYLAAGVDPNANAADFNDTTISEIPAYVTAFSRAASEKGDEFGAQVVVDGDKIHADFSFVSAKGIRNFLAGKGVTSGFFFPEHEARQEDFTDKTHKRFPPELDLAVKAWQSLAKTERPLNVATKTWIKKWIQDNPNSWNGERALGERTIERIATVVNWQKEGGATPTGS